MIVAIEGIDASGKATQARLLEEYLRWRGHDPLPMSFPDYASPTGTVIRQMLRGAVQVAAADPRVRAMLLQAMLTVDRLPHQARLAECRRRGRPVVLDRYWLSGYAYGIADGLAADWLCEIHASLVQPDAWVILDVAPETSVRRRPQREDAYEADLSRLHWARLAYVGAASDPGLPGDPVRLLVPEADPDAQHATILRGLRARGLVE